MSDPNELNPELHARLRKLAGRIFRERGRGPQDTLQPTALLNEAWLKLAHGSSEYKSREHFIAVAAAAMRQILVDRARAAAAQKRGGGAMHRTTLSGVVKEGEAEVDTLALERALRELEAIDEKASRVVVLRVFGGLTLPEIAESMEISLSSAERSWRFARAFLLRAAE